MHRPVLWAVLIWAAVTAPASGEEEPTALPGLSQKEIAEALAVGGPELVEIKRILAEAQKLHLAGNLEGALPGYLEALQLYEEHFAWDPQGTVAILNLLVVVHYKLYQFQEAAGYLERLIGLAEKMDPRSSLLADSWGALCAIAWALKDLEAAEAHCRASQEILERIDPRAKKVIDIWLRRGRIAVARRHFAEARELLDRTRDTMDRWSLRDPKLLADYFSVRGDIAWETRDLAAAEESYEKALKLHSALDPKGKSVAFVLGNLGNVALQRGHFDETEAFYRKALEIFDLLEPGSLTVASGWNNLSALSFQRGDMNRAARELKKSLEIKRKLAPNSPAMFIALAQSALLEVLAGRKEEGHSLLEEAILLRRRGLSEEAATHDPQLATLLLNQAAIFYKTNPEVSLALCREALEILRRVAPGSFELGLAHLTLGVISLEQKNYDAAIPAIREAVSLFEPLMPDSFFLSVSHSLWAMALGRSGHREEALPHLRIALDVMEKQIPRVGGSYEAQARFLAAWGGGFLGPIDGLLELGLSTEAFHALERYRARAFLIMLAERQLGFGRDIPEELERRRLNVADEIQQVLQILSGLNLREDSARIRGAKTALGLLLEKSGDVEAQIREISPRLASLQYPTALTENEAAKALDPGTVLISYFVRKDKIEVHIVPASGDMGHHGTLYIEEKELIRRIRRLEHLIQVGQPDSKNPARTEQFFEVSRGLYDLLLKPFAGTLAAAERLLILPHGPLHRLPFAALTRTLPNGESRYLVEWKPLHFALSATVYYELKQLRSAERPEGPEWVGIGAPTYPEGSPWPELPETQREIEQIAALFPPQSRRTFLGAEAGEWQIRRLDQSPPRILHIAAHGRLERRASTSFLALAPPEGPRLWPSWAVKDPPSNDRLQVWEIYEQVRLPGTELVVLSACDSGSGSAGQGEGLIGFTRAFQYAGARAVLASSWSVDDLATRELMVRFYRHLQSGKTKSESLRAAQLELIRGGEAGSGLSVSSPRHWAGFQLYGDYL